MMRFFLTLLFILAVGTSLPAPLDDPDLGWHIIVGRFIAHHHTFPHTDIWTEIGANKAWIAYSWLPELLFHWVDSHFGWGGFASLGFAFLTFNALCFWLLYVETTEDRQFAGVLVAFVISSLVNHFSVRPQTLTWGFFALSLLFTRSFLLKPSRPTAVMIFLLFCIWANTHISFLIGLFGVVTIIASNSMSEEVRLKLRAFFPLALAVSGTFLTPYLGQEWQVASAGSQDPALFPSVLEFHAATIFSFCTAFLLLQWCTLLVLYSERLCLHSPFLLASFGILSLMSLAIVKFMPYALVLGGYLLALLIKEHKEQALGSLVLTGISKLFTVLTRIPAPAILLIFVLFIVRNIAIATEVSETKLHLPIQATNFILSRNLPMPLLNSFGTGGYLIYRFSNEEGSPRYRPSIDGRTNLFSKEEASMLRNAFLGGERWGDLIERFNPETVLWPKNSPLSSILSESREWCLVFSEQTKAGFNLFVKRSVTISGKDFSCLN